jgi:methionyl-tRNA formyltransferase
MRLVFLGSGEFGLPTLRRLAERHTIAAVLTQPDRPAGRHRRVTPTPVGQWANAAGLTVLKAEDVNQPAVIERVSALDADAGVVIAFGQKLSPELIAACGRLAVNLHASLLPRHRGAAPINWAVINGDSQTGVSVIGLAQRMDAGPIYGQAVTPIGPLETAGELHDRLANMGPDAVLDVLQRFEAGTLQGRPQDESQATKAPKLSKADGWVDWDDSPRRVCCRVHGLTPWPGVMVLCKPRDLPNGPGYPLLLRRLERGDDRDSQLPIGTVLEGFEVVVRGGTVRLLEVQVPGSRTMRIDEFARGHRLAAGDRLEPVRERAT